MMVPQFIYVGDHGRLIVSLQEEFHEGHREGLVIEVPDRLPHTRELVIHRVELEYRMGKPVVLIDFSPYRVGLLTLPVLDIGPYTLRDIQVRVSSVLAADGDDLSLAPEVEGLIVPGTVLIISSAIILLVFLVSILLILSIHGKPWLLLYKHNRLKNHALKSLRRVLMKLSQGYADDGHDPRLEKEALRILCSELRSYLSYRYTYNCLALSPAEFLKIESPLASSEATQFLSKLFKHLDEIRFGLPNLESGEFIQLLQSVSSFLDESEAHA